MKCSKLRKIACTELTEHGLKKFRLSRQEPTQDKKNQQNTNKKRPTLESSLHCKSNTSKIANICIILLLFQNSQFMPEKRVTDIVIYLLMVWLI